MRRCGCVAAKCPRHGDPHGMAVHIKRPVALPAHAQLRPALLGYTRQCAVFQNQSVPEVVEQVLRQHGLEGADFEFRLERIPAT